MPTLDEALPLAEEMRVAVCDIAIDHPKNLVAMAVTMVCAALVQSCCIEGQEAGALRASAAHLLRLADAKQRVS
jgi:hypothetical protein